MDKVTRIFLGIMCGWIVILEVRRHDFISAGLWGTLGIVWLIDPKKSKLHKIVCGILLGIVFVLAVVDITKAG
jgi:hypothetical protein